MKVLDTMHRSCKTVDETVISRTVEQLIF